VNHLTDWTRDELRQLAGKASADASAEALLYANRTYVPATASPAQLPDAVNWTAQGAVTPVKDQGSCGSCWSFGTTGTIEGQAFRQTGRLTPLSQQELMDCTWPMQNRACNGGEDTRSYRWLLENTGGAISTEASYGPYLNAAGWCHWEKATPGARINGYARSSYTSKLRPRYARWRVRASQHQRKQQQRQQQQQQRQHKPS
jgi:hypothetical protein